MSEMTAVEQETEVAGDGELQEPGGEAAGSRSSALVVIGWAVAAALTVAGLAILLVNESHDKTAHQATEARAVAVTHVAQLLSYDYRTVDASLAREKAWLTGSFAGRYASLITSKVAPEAKQAQAVTRAQVTASAVQSAKPNQVDLLLFLNDATLSKDHPKKAQVVGSRLHVRMKYVEGAWRISALDPV